MAIRFIHNIPADKVDQQIRIQKAAGATKVEPIPEEDGEFTLVVTFPDREKLSEFLERIAEGAPPLT